MRPHHATSPTPPSSCRLCRLVVLLISPLIQGRAPISNRPGARRSGPAARERGEAGSAGACWGRGERPLFSDLSPACSLQTQPPLPRSQFQWFGKWLWNTQRTVTTTQGAGGGTRGNRNHGCCSPRTQASLPGKGGYVPTTRWETGACPTLEA